MEESKEIITGNGIKRTISLDQIPFSIERDLATDEWIIRISKTEMDRRLVKPYSRLYNIFMEWGYDEIAESEE